MKVNLDHFLRGNEVVCRIWFTLHLEQWFPNWEVESRLGTLKIQGGGEGKGSGRSYLGVARHEDCSLKTFGNQ